MKEIIYKPIGVIHTQFKEKKDTPIQGVFGKDAKGRVELFPEYAEGLKDLDGFSHIVLIYHFHLSQGYSLLARPFLEDEEKGIFAIRHYRRPNPIGLSIVRLDGVEGNILNVSEVDMIDGTPLLDIKPYVSRFDSREDVKNGWLDNPHLDTTRGEAGKHREE